MSDTRSSTSSEQPRYPNASLGNPPPRHGYNSHGNTGDQEDDVCFDCRHHSGQCWHQVSTTGMPCEEQVEAAITHIAAKNRKLQEIHGFCIAILDGPNYSADAHALIREIVAILDGEPENVT